MEWKKMRNYENHTASSLSQYAAEKIDASVSILAKNNSFLFILFILLASMILTSLNHDYVFFKFLKLTS